MSTPPADFDHVAHEYDVDFTHSLIGQLQRKRVWAYLNQYLAGKENLKILELNCGTGEDAIQFAQLGHQILATDISSEMVKCTQIKIIQNHLTDFVDTQIIAIEDIVPQKVGEGYDLVFSNFGGLNCVSAKDLEAFSTQLSNILKDQGRFMAVVMPNYCLMESLYFLAKRNRQQMWRRNTPNGIAVNVDGKEVHTYYYAPKKFYNLFINHFELVGKEAVALFVPPSYMEGFFKRNQGMLRNLNRLDGLFHKLPISAKWADHFLIDLVKN